MERGRRWLTDGNKTLRGAGWLVLASLAWPVAAAADCLLPPLVLLWSYPADGQSDVPVDATLWVFASQGEATPPVSATLNGQHVPGLVTKSDSRLGQAAFRPESLLPDTDYAWRVLYSATDGADQEFQIAFRTGSKTAGEARATVRSQQTRSPAFLEEHPCSTALRLQSCFDNPGQSLSMRTFTAETDNLIAWYIKPAGFDPTYFWPAACGDPTIITEASAEPGCYYLYGLDARGDLASLTRHCGAAQPSAKPFSASSAPHYRGVLEGVTTRSKQQATTTAEPEPVPASSLTAEPASKAREARDESRGPLGCNASAASTFASSWPVIAAMTWALRRRCLRPRGLPSPS